MASKEDLGKLHAYCKGRLSQKFDPSLPIAMECPKITEPHKGFYLGLSSSSNKDLAQSGFLKENLNDVNKSVENVIESFFAELRGKDINYNQIETGNLFLYLVKDVIYIPRPMDWDENKDGLYFMWGQKFRGLYLPYQIKLLSCSKVEVLDRLCGLSGIINSAWRLPEGLVWAIKTEHYPE